MITEEVKTKAKEFAINALQGQIDALADAYLKGYEDALKTVPHEPIYVGRDTFVDLMLDSGTMWTSRTHRDKKDKEYEMGYLQAIEYGLPTQEQFEEMFSVCRRDNAYLVSRNAKRILLPVYVDNMYVWVKSDIVNDEALAYKITPHGPELVRMFTGTELPFFCVKNKNEQ